jgi:hypothetical protein
MRSSGVFPSGVPGKRLLLAGVEVNATLLDPKTPQELNDRDGSRVGVPLRVHPPDCNRRDLRSLLQLQVMQERCCSGWVKQASDSGPTAAIIREGKLFRAVRKDESPIVSEKRTRDLSIT